MIINVKYGVLSMFAVQRESISIMIINMSQARTQNIDDVAQIGCAIGNAPHR